MRLFLIGFMGSGKTHWGQLLANHWQVPLFDLDAVIEAASGKTIAQIFDAQGEEYFRELERETLQALIDRYENMILSTGGGTPCYFNNIELMKSSGKVIWLNTAIEVIATRLKNEKAKRPLVRDISDEELHAFILKKMNDRRIYYEQAHKIVLEDQIDFDTLLKAIEHA